MEILQNPLLTGFLAHQVRYWEVHALNDSSFSLVLYMSQHLTTESAETTEKMGEVDKPQRMQSGQTRCLEGVMYLRAQANHVTVEGGIALLG